MKVQKVLKSVDSVLNSGHDSNQSDLVNSLSFGKRLREERERLGLSQSELAQAGGVARTTQHIYETDVRSPDVAYLERLRGLGVDLSYLVVGTRLPATAADAQTISYAALLNVFRIVDEFCVDEDGARLPVEARVRFFQLLCVSARAKGASDPDLETLRNELRRLTAT